MSAEARLLGAADIRRLAAGLELSPTKKLGQNFVHDGNTVRRIVRIAGVTDADTVLEVGPGLGSLTLGLLETGARVVAVEIDRRLAALLPDTVAEFGGPDAVSRLTTIRDDAMTAVIPTDAGGPTRLVANLPYNVAVPVLLRLLADLPSLEAGVVMVQAEVGERLAAGPGSKIYGSPSVKAAWYGRFDTAGTVGRQVFWPVPNVESVLVRFARHEQPRAEAERLPVFQVIDAAFQQRRKTLRQGLSGLAGGTEQAEALLREAGIDPGERGERLDVEAFVALGRAFAARASMPPASAPQNRPPAAR